MKQKLANQLFQEKLAQSGIADKNFVKFMENFAPGGPQGSSQTVQAKMIAQHHKAVAQQAKNANRAVNQFFSSIDKQQRAITKSRRTQGAFRLPKGARGFFDKFTESQNKFESMTRKVRTKAQRLNTYGLFFLETMQVNPIYTAGKFILNTLSGFCLLYTSPSPRD